MLTPDNTRVDGLHDYVAGLIPDGVCIIIEVWDSQEVMQPFFQSKVAAALGRRPGQDAAAFLEVINVFESPQGR